MPQTNQNIGNHKPTELKQPPRVSTDTHESKAKSDFWEVKIIHKEAQGTHSWSPQRNLEVNAPKFMN
jgi:hypothetical protein